MALNFLLYNVIARSREARDVMHLIILAHIRVHSYHGSHVMNS